MIVGAVLTGGASRRMGATKALIDIDGVAMARRVVDALEAGGCEPVVLIGGSPSELAPIQASVVEDQHPGAGPLGGVITALAWARTLPRGDASDASALRVVVSACDLARLDGGSVARLISVATRATEQGSAADVVVAHDDRRQPALAVWDADVLDRLRALFVDGVRSLNSAVDAVRWTSCQVDASAMTNVNRPTDLVGGAD